MKQEAVEIVPTDGCSGKSLHRKLGGIRGVGE